MNAKLEIMYVEDDPNIAEIYSVMIKEIYPDCEVICFNDGLKAQQELKNNPTKYSLIISDYKLPTISGAELFKFTNSQMLGIPFLLLSGFDCSTDGNFKNFFDSHVRNAMLVKPIEMGEFAEKIDWCLGGEQDLLKIYEKNTKSMDEKIPINSSVFLKLNLVPCDVFLRLNDGKFVKVINKKEIFESRLIQKLMVKGITHFFVNRSELSLYADSVTRSLNFIIKTKKKKIDDVQKSQLTNKSLELIKSNLLKCGFSETIIQTSDEVIDMQLELIEKNPEFDSFLKKFQNFRKANTEHTRVVCYVVVSILKELMWDSESTMHKMCLASILHDITLSDSMIQKNLFFDDHDSLSEEEKKMYIRHTEEASHLAKNFEDASGGIEQFILEHHELPDGKGFPRKLNYNHIHPLSAVLHISDFITHLMWKYDFDMDKVNEEVQARRSYYLRGFYRKPFEAIYRTLRANFC